jgi:spoIIIJ-associated protein
MSQEKTTLEVIAPTVDEAIQKGLLQLGVSSEDVEVEILDSGSRGLFGIGGRQARVRISLNAGEAGPVTGATYLEEPEPEGDQTAYEEEEMEEMGVNSSLDRSDYALDISRKTVSDLLSKMNIKAQVHASFKENQEKGEDDLIYIDIQGNDLSILIGRRSETLNALQYIASLIVCKRLNSRVSLQIDVQGYRARRERQLRTLARRMAEQAVHTGRRQILEPMPASERRVIHMELRSYPDVITESIGEDPNRKVTIVPKQDSSS